MALRLRMGASVLSLALVFAGCGEAKSTDSGLSAGSEAGNNVDGEAPPEPADPSAVVSSPAALPPVLPQPCKLGEPGVVSNYVFCAPTGRLGYRRTPRGNALLDFSFVGYLGGGMALPTVPTTASVTPSGGDDTAAIQAALDATAQRPIGSNGYRGAVQLGAGAFKLAGTLTVRASGVVLRGAGSRAGGTTLTASGAPRILLQIAGVGSWTLGSARFAVTDARVQSGALALGLSTTEGLHVGDTVLVRRPVTKAWLTALGMDKLVKGGVPQTWLAAGSVLSIDRVITQVTPKTITLDAPIADMMDAAVMGPDQVMVVPYTFAGRIERVGLEKISLVAPLVAAPLSAPHFSGVSVVAAQDIWLRDMVVHDCGAGAVSLESTSKRVTVQDVLSTRAAMDITAGLPSDIVLRGSQTLVLRGGANASQGYNIVTHGMVAGPNVVSGFIATGTDNQILSAQRWATGLLIDAVNMPGTKLAFANRGTTGSGQGWSMAYGVVFNARLGGYVVQQPPTADNWALGSTGPSAQPAGTTDAAGVVESPGAAVWPPSLYREQLRQRLGDAALDALAP